MQRTIVRFTAIAVFATSCYASCDPEKQSGSERGRYKLAERAQENTRRIEVLERETAELKRRLAEIEQKGTR